MKRINGNDLVACIVEGKTEKIILEMILEDDLLFFSKDNLLDQKILEIKFRNPKIFTDTYLTLSYHNTELYLIVIKDDKKDYKIPNPYNRQITKKLMVTTSPEIEILMIISLNKYDEYTKKYKSKYKPSEYLKIHFYNKQNIKSEKFIRDFYKKYSLRDAIEKYHSYTTNSTTLFDLFSD
ncbi:TPA: hypothetical protein R1903_001564 [Staphylococcus delphini]|nr:hypothetical protein [Staphylococcus delphini]HEC2150695.1 hypothetical protein [Staphylococcus delphini]HEC2171056.1 hypothetical protein [Staphylococcus delphini]HEC2182599.1 hypothetical protein [Staphylococcus delphini]HEC2191889.1 hypothetical protein [Staphylococcus delphini]